MAGLLIGSSAPLRLNAAAADADADIDFLADGALLVAPPDLPKVVLPVQSELLHLLLLLMMIVPKKRKRMMVMKMLWRWYPMQAAGEQG